MSKDITNMSAALFKKSRGGGHICIIRLFLWCGDGIGTDWLEKS